MLWSEHLEILVKKHIGALPSHFSMWLNSAKNKTGTFFFRLSSETTRVVLIKLQLFVSFAEFLPPVWTKRTRSL